MRMQFGFSPDHSWSFLLPMIMKIPRLDNYELYVQSREPSLQFYHMIDDVLYSSTFCSCESILFYP